MKNYKKLFLIIVIFIFTSCVQKSSKKTVIVKLRVNGIKNIETVGVRGSQKPLSWNNDMELKPIIKDSLYTTTFSIVTGYKFTEAKFTVNGQFELQEKDNRKITYSNNDTTLYEATFDVR